MTRTVCEARMRETMYLRQDLVVAHVLGGSASLGGLDGSCGRGGRVVRFARGLLFRAILLNTRTRVLVFHSVHGSLCSHSCSQFRRGDNTKSVV